MKPTNDSALLDEFWQHGRPTDWAIFDAHAHYGPFHGIYFPERGEAAAMLSVMDRVGVRIALVSGHTALMDPRRGNEVVASLVAAHPDRFRGYVVVNPRDAQQVAQAIDGWDDWQRHGFVGFKLHPTIHQYRLTGPAYRPLLAFASERRVPILSHTWGSDETCDALQVRDVVERYPHIPFLAGHACYGDWDSAILLARSYANLYLELTAAYAFNGLLERMVDEAGAEKVLFGNDLPWFDSMYAVGCVLGAHISDEARHAILHRNAERIFDIGPVG